MTSLGRSPRKPKESSRGSRVLTAGDIAAEIDTEQETAPVDALIVDDDDSYEIDVDGPSYDEPAVLPVAEVAPAASAAVVAKPKREKKVRPPREPRPAKEPKPAKEPNALKEPKPAKTPKTPKPVKSKPVKASKAAKPAKLPKPAKPPKTPRPPRERTGDFNRYWSTAATVIGSIGLLCSVILATGALFIALDTGLNGFFFSHLSDTCDALVGPLKGVFNFTGVNAAKKEALVGWGLGSMGYLLIGRFAQSMLMTRVKE